MGEEDSAGRFSPNHQHPAHEIHSLRVPSICQLLTDQIAQVIDNKYSTLSPLESKIALENPSKSLIPKDRSGRGPDGSQILWDERLG